MLAAAHPEQAERLRALRAYEILDTPREADFDEIVALASRICETPISVINMIDEERQWFKAEVGLGARETPLETSICSHVILQDDFVEISDTLQDRRMADNPLCTAEGGLRFYAGARLLASNGLPVGTLCVLDNRPRKLNDLQRETLRVLARQVMLQMELRLALKNQHILMQEADHRIKNSLQTLTSIVRLYGHNLNDDHANEAFGAVQRRIDAISALHGELQASNSTGTTNARAFLNRIVELLQESAPKNITITCEAEDINLSAGASSAIGLIVSEFVANSVKHGFPDDVAGKVDISFRQTGDLREVECRDNGIGSLGVQREETRNSHLGSRLMSAAASQLGGELSEELTAEGSRLTLRF